jgi:hypothetical protein
MRNAFVTVKVPRMILLSGSSALLVWLVTLPAVIRNGSALIIGAHAGVLVLAFQGLIWGVAEGPSRRARWIIALSILGSIALQLRLQ